MADRTPSFFFLVPGAWSTTDALVAILQPVGMPVVQMGQELEPGVIGVEVVHDDQGFGDAVGFMPGRITDADIEACARAQTAAIIEVSGTLHDRHDVVRSVCAILQMNGGLAVRFEGSGKAHSLEGCVDSLTTGDMSELLQLGLVYSFDGEHYFSIGMQQFDRPDIEVSGIEEDIAGHWLHMFCVLTVIEDPVLGDGHTFSPDDDTPRQVLERWPDLRHGAEDGRQNPFGLWRALPPGVEGLSILDPEPVIMPPLLTFFAMKEQQAGQPLEEAEVTEIIEKAAAIDLEPADARAMERTRGFADINTRRAWKQWQLLRDNA